jgi:hypothetical protein
MLLEGESPVIQKLNGIHEAGTTALRAGAVEPFKGYGPELKNRYGVALRYSEDSERLVRTRVLDGTEKLAKELGIEFFVAGKPKPEGYPLHTTLLEGLLEDEVSDYERSLRFATHPAMEYHPLQSIGSPYETKLGNRLWNITPCNRLAVHMKLN